MEYNEITEKLGMKPVSTLPLDAAKLKATINEEALLHHGDLVTIPEEISWGQVMINGTTAYAVPCTKLNASGEEEPYAFFPHAFRRRVTVGRIEGDAFRKEETITPYTGTFVEEYLEAYNSSADVNELMDKLKGKSFKVIANGVDSRPSMGFLDGQPSPLAKYANPRDKNLWILTSETSTPAKKKK